MEKKMFATRRKSLRPHDRCGTQYVKFNPSDHAEMYFTMKKIKNKDVCNTDEILKSSKVQFYALSDRRARGSAQPARVLRHHDIVKISLVW